MNAVFGIVVFLLPCCLNATDVQYKYVGKSGCLADLASASNHYGIRLDREKRTRLEARVFTHETVLTLVQYSSDSDRCGVVRDAIESHASDRSFVWECVDKRRPSDVIVATWPTRSAVVSGPAITAWRVDLRSLKFIRLSHQAVCDAGNYAGNDTGEDLKAIARSRAARLKSKDSFSR